MDDIFESKLGRPDIVKLALAFQSEYSKEEYRDIGSHSLSVAISVFMKAAYGNLSQYSEAIEVLKNNVRELK